MYVKSMLVALIFHLAQWCHSKALCVTSRMYVKPTGAWSAATSVRTYCTHPASGSWHRQGSAWVMGDSMVASLRGDGDASQVVTMRPLLARCLFQLIVETGLGARLGQEVLDEMQEMNWQVSLVENRAIAPVCNPY
jgi:hypothetical protein